MKKMKRAVVVVLDGAGAGWQAIGGDGDALRQVVEREKPDLPNLEELGFKHLLGLQDKDADDPIGCYGEMTPAAAGRDTVSTHWELAGLTLKEPFPTYPEGFPQEIIDAFEEETGMGTLGNRAASSADIIQALGAEHLRTGKLIVYTSAESVFEIAAHEAVLPAMELWHVCRIARRVLKGKHGVGRVIARPFEGNVGAFTLTANRRDFPVDPLGRTMLDALKGIGYDVMAVGKSADLFNNRGVTQSVADAGNDACLDAAADFLKKDRWRGLLLVDLADTDGHYGRDAAGVARSLEALDARLPELMKLLGEDGLLFVTADDGSRRAPLLVWGLGVEEGVNLPPRKSLADVSATVLEALGCGEKLDGVSFYKDIAL